jgi:hypothetical protein
MVKIKKPGLTLVLAVFICISVAAGIVSAASLIPSYNYSNLTVANSNGTRFHDYNATAYNFFNGTGGVNTPYITPSNTSTSGNVTFTNATSGTFYIGDDGGRGWEDDGILMIAVNGTLPNNFSVNITSSGYVWTPVLTGSYPDYNGTMQNYTTIRNSFSKTSFTGSTGYTSTWKPAPGANYPIYENENMSNTTNFSIIFADLYVGIIGQNTLSSPGWSGNPVINNGRIQVNYTVSNLPKGSLMAFDAYAFCRSSNAGDGIRWTNAVNTPGNKTATSGYYVTNF